MAAAVRRTFWANRANQMSAFEIRNRHMTDRAADKKARFQVRRMVKSDGVVSNLYPVEFAEGAVLHRYELDIVRQTRPTADGQRIPLATVAPTRAWRMYSQSLRKHPSLPPLVRVGSRVYCASALPETVLDLPKEYHDVGWEKCTLKYLGQEEIAQIPSFDLKAILNKMLPWSIAYHAKTDGHFAVVREVDGKMVCTEDGLSIAGLRVFRGTTAAMLQITASSEPATTQADDGNLPTSNILGALQEGGLVNSPVLIRVVKLLRQFEYSGKPVGVYLVADASGATSFSFWGGETNALVSGQNYLIEGFKVKKVNPKFSRKEVNLQVELESQAGRFRFTLQPKPESGTIETPVVEKEVVAERPKEVMALRLDTRCTVASEKSLWDEVQQHFGDGPYDDDKQRRITRAVQGTPVVLSTSLRHTTVRTVRFDYTSPDDAPLDPQMRQLIPDLDKSQPYAVVHDYSIVPLQALHCCFDPKMRSWQQVTIPACSFMPTRRNEVLSKFRQALAGGLDQWGAQLKKDAWATKAMTLLDEPAKARASALNLNHPAPSNAGPSNRPRTYVFTAICPSRASSEDKDRCEKTSTSIAKSFRSNHAAVASDEQDALSHIDSVLLPQGTLKDPDCVAIFVCMERELRANRWLQAECMRRGVMPIMVRGVNGDKRQKLLGDNLRFTTGTKFSLDPLKGIDLASEVPSLQGKNVLMIGVDTCHTQSITTGACVGLLATPHGNHVLPQFWRNEIRGKEVEQVNEHFLATIQAACARTKGNQLDEVIVFQDGSVFSELESMKRCVPESAKLSFMCLHKRTNIRFVHQGGEGDANVIKGAIVRELTPLPMYQSGTTPSFYLQSHDCFMSTARTVQYLVHHVSDSVPIPDLQKLAYTLAHVGGPLSTKLPLPTRCAHRLSGQTERLIDACPGFTASQIPEPLSNRCWFL